jgi:hypothetical protein
MSVRDAAQSRGIEEILHFTTDKGVLGSIRKQQLLSRARVQDDPDLAFIFQDVWPRRDLAWIDYVSLSISRINRQLYDKAARNLPERWWAIMSFGLEILDHDDVWFTTTNNVYDDVCARGTGVDGFEALFGPRIPWGYHGSVKLRPAGHPPELPTDEQAEMLYPGAVPLQCLRVVYVQDEQRRALIRAWCDVLDRPEPPVEVEASRFR